MSYIEIEKISLKIISRILFVRTYIKEMVLDITPDRQKKTIVIRYASVDRPPIDDKPLIALKYSTLIRVSKNRCGASEYENPEYAVVSLTLLHNPALLRRMLALTIRSTTEVLCEAPEHTYSKWAEIEGGDR